MNVHLPIDEELVARHDHRYELVMTFADVDEAVAILTAFASRPR